MLSTAQLRGLGLDRHAVRRRVRSGRLRPVFPRAFALAGVELTARGFMRAAAFAGGEEALVGHCSATVLWELMPRWDGPVDLLLWRGRGPSHPGLRVHRTRWLPAEHRTRRHGIPVVTPARAVLDAGTMLAPVEHELVVAGALRRRLTTRRELEALARTRRPGALPLRAQLERVGGPQITRSGAERRLLELIRQAELEPPRTNVRVLGRERDLVWAEAKVVAEFDGFAFHWSPEAMALDHRRDAELASHGWRPVRYTWPELTERPVVVIARLAAALAVGHTLREWVSGSTPPA